MTNPGKEKWIKHTTPYERIRSIVETVSQPRSVDWIADESGVSKEDADSILGQLSDVGLLHEWDNKGETRYSPDPIHTRKKILRELLDEYTVDELQSLDKTLRARSQIFIDQWDVNDPTRLFERANDIKDASQRDDIRRTATEWISVEYYHGLVDEALRVNEYLNIESKEPW